jgi:hypothetical protein
MLSKFSGLCCRLLSAEAAEVVLRVVVVDLRFPPLLQCTYTVEALLQDLGHSSHIGEDSAH